MVAGGTKTQTRQHMGAKRMIRNRVDASRRGSEKVTRNEPRMELVSDAGFGGGGYGLGYGEGDRGNKGQAGMDFDEGEEKESAPGNGPAAIEFAREDGDDGIDEVESAAGLDEEFH